MLAGKRFCSGSNRKTPKSPSIQGFWRHLSSVNLRQNPERQEILKTVWGQPHKGSNPFLSAIKSLENTTFSRLFSFLPGSAFDRFLLNFSLVSRNFSSNRKSQKPLIHKGVRDFCSGRFLEIFFVCVVWAIFSMKTQIVFIFIATDLAFCPAQYNPICIEHRC